MRDAELLQGRLITSSAALLALGNFAMRPSLRSAAIGIAGWVGTDYAQKKLRSTVISGFMEASKGDLSQGFLEPVKDSAGVDRTEEIVQAFEKIKLSFSDQPDYADIVVKALWAELLRPDFRKNMADLMSDDREISSQALGQLIKSDLSKMAVGKIPSPAHLAVDVREGVTELEHRRMDTDEAMEELGLELRQDDETLTLNNPEFRAQVRKKMGGREPLAYGEGGLYDNIYKDLIKLSEGSSSAVAERSFFDILKPSDKKSTDSKVSDRIDDYLSNMRQHSFNLKE